MLLCKTGTYGLPIGANLWFVVDVVVGIVATIVWRTVPEAIGAAGFSFDHCLHLAIIYIQLINLLNIFCFKIQSLWCTLPQTLL